MQPQLFNIDTALITNRLTIRRFREGDGLALYDLVQQNQSLIQEHLPVLADEITHPERSEAFVRRKMAAWLLQEEFVMSIWRNDEADLVGLIGLTDFDWYIPKAEVNYFLDHRQVGKGLMTESMARLIPFAFKQLGLEKISLRALADNNASQRLARKVGFRREGDLRAEHRKLAGGLVDIALFGLTREEYGMK